MTLSSLAQRIGTVAAVAAAGAGLSAGQAAAHASDRGFVMLLPTGYYMAGGALAVAFSFVVLALVPPSGLDRLFRWRLPFAAAGDGLRILTSLLSLLSLAGLVAAGWWGSRDPLSNPLPLVIWTVWWVGLTLVQGLVFDLWRWLDPWYGPWRLVLLATGRREGNPRFVLPERLGRLPAIVLFFAFAWFELVYPAPDDPARLATVVGLYWLLSFAGILLFGHRAWTRQVECFSVFFGFVARLAILQGETDADGRRKASLRLPGAGAAEAARLEISGVLFLLLALASVSFDGLMRTFAWVSALGVNPLEFPGRSALIESSTFGLIFMFVLLSAAFLAAVWLGERLASSDLPFGAAAGKLIWSIVPISLAYHFAHYLVSLVVNAQYALAAISDPFANGWNLFGTAEHHVHAGAVAGAEAAWIIWNWQAAAIVAGHVLAVVIAHVVAYRLHGSHFRAGLSQLPLAILMVAYTVFGLWLLSAPTAA